MSLIIEKFTDEELMDEVFYFVNKTGDYATFYKVYKITKKYVYLVKLNDIITESWYDGDCSSTTYQSTGVFIRRGKKSYLKIKREEIDDCNWGKTFNYKSYIWE